MADAIRERSIGWSAEPCALVPELQWRRFFPGERSQLTVVRRWVRALLPACPARDDLTTVVTELASNAVRHTASGGGWFAVEIIWRRTMVRVTVADCGAPGGPQFISEPDDEHGRGLRIVAGLSVCAGVRGDERGRQVWADISWDEAVAVMAGEA